MRRRSSICFRRSSASSSAASRFARSTSRAAFSAETSASSLTGKPPAGADNLPPADPSAFAALLTGDCRSFTPLRCSSAGSMSHPPLGVLSPDMVPSFNHFASVGRLTSNRAAACRTDSLSTLAPSPAVCPAIADKSARQAYGKSTAVDHWRGRRFPPMPLCGGDKTDPLSRLPARGCAAIIRLRLNPPPPAPGPSPGRG